MSIVSFLGSSRCILLLIITNLLHSLPTHLPSLNMGVCSTTPSTCLKSSEDVPAGVAFPRIESMLVNSIEALQPDASLDSEDKVFISRLIFDSMTTSGRVYHAMQHVFDISEDMTNPILILSALFHDIVYYSIDKEFSPEQEQLLKDVLVPDTQQLTLAPTIEDRLFDKVVRMYGFVPGDELPKLGTNEFLSALIGVRILSKWLSDSQLMEIAACIEATIPFRPIVDGKSPMDRLYDRVKLVCPDESEEWLVATVQNAATTANFDLCSFDSTDRDFFLDSSWKLIPEARPALLLDDCPLIEWMNEMKSLEGRTVFLRGAVPKIFQSFRGSPTDEAMAEKERMTHENLDIMWEYAKVRQLQAMILVGVVEAMGEDPAAFPLQSCLAMDVPAVPQEQTGSLSDVEQIVRNWLVKGRRAAFHWDPAASPLGAYLFDSLGTKGVAEALEIGKNQKPGSHELLKYLPKSVVVTVSTRLGAVFTDRADRFSEVPEKLGILAQ